MFDKNTTLAFTGNRKLTSKDNRPFDVLMVDIYDHLERIIEREYLENGIRTFISGMALGFDTICAIIVSRLRGKFPDIQFVAAVPFFEQAKKYSLSDKEQYQQLLDAADVIVVVGGYSFSNNAYHKRNDFMIKNSCKLIAYYDGAPRSGTGSTIRKAKSLGLEVYNLYDL